LAVYDNESTLVVAKDVPVQNDVLSPWKRYRTEILTMLAVVLLQSATVIALFVQRRRKIRLQAELNLERLELAYLSRTSQLGELSGALAHELNQPLTSILANAESGVRLLDNDPIDVKELRDILGDIVLDNKRAATVITQLRRLMIRGETSLEPMDFNHAVTTTLALARSELLPRQSRAAAASDPQSAVERLRCHGAPAANAARDCTSDAKARTWRVRAHGDRPGSGDFATTPLGGVQAICEHQEDEPWARIGYLQVDCAGPWRDPAFR
jgi:signal transduction histidine kinase